MEHSKTARPETSYQSARCGRKTDRPPGSSHAGRGKSPELTGVPILVVDDDAPSAKLLSVVLSGESCDVKIATDAEEALLMLQTFKPRVVVIDLILPLMSGLLLAERLRADPAKAGMLLIAVTAFNGREVERLARQAGFAAYLRKPIDPLSFAQLVAEKLGGIS